MSNKETIEKVKPRREMTQKEILAIYKIAEKHWSRPAWLCKILGWNYTKSGLCFYFIQNHFEYFNSKSFVFEMLWFKYRTKDDDFHFHTRKERLQAIRNVIKDLENEQ